jgi:hypothetical protein
MHRVVNASTSGSVGDLGRIARALADDGFNIEAIGGGEGFARGGSVGHISLHLTPDEDVDIERARNLLEGLDLADLGTGARRLDRVETHPCLDIELDDRRGELAELAELLGNAGINILSCVTIDVHANWAIVAMAFEEGQVDAARALIEGVEEPNGDKRFPVHDKHGGQHRRNQIDRNPGNRFKKGDRDPR